MLSVAHVARNTEALSLLEELRAALINGAPAIPATAVTVRTGSQTILHLNEGGTGKPLAVMDATNLLQLRAQLVAALAVDALAAPEAKRVALLGGGPMASGTLKSLRLIRALREVWLVATDVSQMLIQSAQLQQTLKTPVRAVDTAAEAVANADIVVLAEGIPLPEVTLWPSVHLSVPITAGFPTAPFTTGLLAKTWRVSETRAEVWHLPVHAELGGVLAGTAQRPEGMNTLFLGVGTPALDLLAAWHVYQGALTDEALTRIDFEA